MRRYSAILTSGREVASVAAVLTFLLLVEIFLSARFDRMKNGIDFPVFYSAAQMVRHGAAAQLYDVGAQQAFQRQFTNRTGSVFAYPPVTAVFLSPLALLSFKSAYIVWTGVSLALVAISGLLLARRPAYPSATFLIPAMFGFAPLLLNFMQGQFSTVLLLVYAVTLITLERGREATAGLILSLGTLKYPLVLPFVLVLLLAKRWRFVAGFFSGAALMGLVSVALCGWTIVPNYFHLISQLPSLPGSGVHPIIMPDFHGLLFLLTGHEPRIWLLLLISLPLLIWASRNWNAQPVVHLEDAFAITLISTLLVSYYTNPHDLTLMLIPLVLSIKRARQAPVMAAIAVAIYLPPLFVLLLVKHWLPAMSILMTALMLTFGRHERTLRPFARAGVPKS